MQVTDRCNLLANSTAVCFAPNLPGQHLEQQWHFTSCGGVTLSLWSFSPMTRMRLLPKGRNRTANCSTPPILDGRPTVHSPKVIPAAASDAPSTMKIVPTQSANLTVEYDKPRREPFAHFLLPSENLRCSPTTRPRPFRSGKTHERPPRSAYPTPKDSNAATLTPSSTANSGSLSMPFLAACSAIGPQCALSSASLALFFFGGSGRCLDSLSFGCSQPPLMHATSDGVRIQWTNRVPTLHQSALPQKGRGAPCLP